MGRSARGMPGVVGRRRARRGRRTGSSGRPLRETPQGGTAGPRPDGGRPACPSRPRRRLPVSCCSSPAAGGGKKVHGPFCLRLSVPRVVGGRAEQARRYTGQQCPPLTCSPFLPTWAGAEGRERALLRDRSGNGRTTTSTRGPVCSSGPQLWKFSWRCLSESWAHLTPQALVFSRKIQVATVLFQRNI